MSAQTATRRSRTPVQGAARARSQAVSEYGSSELQLAPIQRARLIASAVGAIAECGYTGATVANITNRVRVSRRTFYELFANREECVIAVLDQVVEMIAGELDAAALGDLPWRERVRGGLAAILRFFDREPVLARVCVVEVARGGALVLARREELLTWLVTVIDAGREEGKHGRERSRLIAEGLVGAALAIIQTRLARGDREPLGDLLGELMSMIVLPYLGAAAARREQLRPTPAAERFADGEPHQDAHAAFDPLTGVAMRLTYRTVRVLQSVAEYPGASNRETAERAGISDAGQVSKLLARLQANGLLDNGRARHLKGEPNVWRLTTKGQQVVRSIRPHTHVAKEAA